MRLMNRREFLEWSTLTGLASALFGFSCATTEPRSNVLFFTLDDMNDWVGCLSGHPDARTPNIDHLAQQGTLFTRAYGPGVDCSSSRTALMTGLRPTTSGVYSNREDFRTLLPDAVSLPQHFIAHGYDVLGAGKIFHRPDEASWQEFYFPQAVDLFKYRSLDRDGYGFPVRDKPKRAPRSMFNWGPIDIDENEMFDSKIAAWAAERLARKSDRPFFLGVGFFLPHQPWLVPRQYFAPFPPEEISLPKVKKDDVRDVPELARWRTFSRHHRRVVESGQWRHAVSAYLASVLFVDTMVGRVLSALDTSAHRDRTIVVLCSDHGYHLGQKNHWHKFVLWEQATRVPLIVAAPGIGTPGSRCDRPVDLVHLYPTLAELCELSPPKGLDGKSLRPLLEDPTAAWEQPALTSLSPQDHAVRTKRWRYIRHEDGSEELYDHSRDPLEWENLATRKRFRKIKKKLSRWLPESPAGESPTPRPPD